MGNLFVILAVCDGFVYWRCFEKAFCQAGEVDIQDYVPAQNVFNGIFLHATYYYGEADICTGRPLSAAFVDSGLFVVNLKCVNVVFWSITHYTNYIIFEKNQTK